MKPTEQKVYNFIKQYHEEHALMPTVREIRDGVGLKSTGSVQYVLTHLRERGLIANANNKSRSCQIVGDKSLTYQAKWQMLKELVEAEKANAIHKAEQCTSGYDLLFMMINDYSKVLDEMNKMENGDKNENKSVKIS